MPFTIKPLLYAQSSALSPDLLPDAVRLAPDAGSDQHGDCDYHQHPDDSARP